MDIPKNGNGLYKLISEVEVEANAVGDSLTLVMLHNCLGHISPVAVKKLV